MLGNWSITSPLSLGHTLKTIRLEKKLTQKDFSDLIGVRQATVSLIERHPEKVTIETLFKVMSVLNVQMTLSDRRQTISSTWNGKW